jgi:ATP-binding cassette subfamily E protein 1
MRPNLGRFSEPPEWKEVLKHFRGSELQQFFTRMLEENMKALIKVQYVDSVAKQPKVNSAIVGRRLRVLDKKDLFETAVEQLEL